MSIYMAYLPKAFPILILGKRRNLVEVIRTLMELDTAYSFAFTADTNNGGLFKLWLSETSYRVLSDMGALKGVLDDDES